MATVLLQSSVGAGKTEAALDLLASVLQQHTLDPFPRAWVLTATKRQEVAFRQRLIDPDPKQHLFFNTEFFNFYNLNTRLLNLLKVPPRRIEETARLGILRRLIDESFSELRLYQPIAHTAGFISVIADFIYELKQNGITPEDFAQKPTPTDKDHDILLLYDRYQRTLIDHNLVDREGEAWLAEEYTRPEHQDEKGIKETLSTVKLLIVDGYDQFTPIQARLLANISLQVGQVFVTLTQTPPNSQENIGKRFDEARQTLQEAHERLDGASLEVYESHAQDASPDLRCPNLQHLTAHAFRVVHVTPPTSLEGVVWIEGADPAQETAAVLRHIKQLIVAQKARPDDILIAVRDWTQYGAHFAHYGTEYGLPLLLNYAQSLLEMPFIVALQNVLSLVNHNFERERVLDVLRSPYLNLGAVGLTPDDVAILEAKSAESQLIDGKDEWLKIFGNVQKWYDDDDDRNEDDGGKSLSSEGKVRLETAVQMLFEGLTPPETATRTEYVKWIVSHIATLAEQEADEVIEATAEQTPRLPLINPNIASDAPNTDAKTPLLRKIEQRDVDALRAFYRLLKGVLHVEELLKKLMSTEHQLTWEAFWSEITATLKGLRVGETMLMRNGRILITSVSDARGLPHPHVVIVGLAEGLFPAPIPEDMLYLDSERKAFQQAGIRLELQSERAADDSLFYELIGSASRSLILSRPTLKEGKPWNESHLWREIRRVAGGKENTKTYSIGNVTPLEEASSLQDVLLALAEEANNPTPSTLFGSQLAWFNVYHPRLWAQVKQGRTLETQRANRNEPFNRYSGVIQNKALRQQIATAVQNKAFSATALKQLSQCAYGYFAKYMLHLTPLETPQMGLNKMIQGSVLHEILHQVYGAIKSENLEIHPDNLLRAEQIMYSKLPDIFESAPTKFKFAISPLWIKEQGVFVDIVERVLKADFADNSPFAMGLMGERTIEALEQELPKNKEIRIRLGDKDVKLTGFIDRIDRVGDKRVIIDYKLNTVPKQSEIDSGDNFQMMVYLLLAQEAYGDVEEGLFYSLKRDTDAKDKTLTVSPASQATTQDTAARLIDFAEQAKFPTKAKKLEENIKCSSFCELYQLCRLSTTSPYKAEV